MGGMTMLTAGALNGIVIWFRNIINWFKRIWYAMHSAIVVSGVCEEMEPSNRYQGQIKYSFRITDDNKAHSVTVYEFKNRLETVGKGSTVELLWIPDNSKAIPNYYKADEKSRKVVLICDVISVISLAIFIIGWIIMGTAMRRLASNSSNTALSAGCIYGSVIIMIIASIVRKKFRKS